MALSRTLLSETGFPFMNAFDKYDDYWFRVQWHTEGQAVLLAITFAPSAQRSTQ